MTDGGEDFRVRSGGEKGGYCCGQAAVPRLDISTPARVSGRILVIVGIDVGRCPA
jgi:hypothetical protein